MAIGLVIIGGVAGFGAALMALLLGHGFWTAMLAYWQVGILAMLFLIGLQVVTIVIRAVNSKFDTQAAYDMKTGPLGFPQMKRSVVKQTPMEPTRRQNF